MNVVPVGGAKVTATVIDSILTPGPFYKTCTTYTNNSGFYKFDSLWPVRYWMTASFGGYQPYGELSPQLCALWLQNLNFVGIDNNLRFEAANKSGLYIFPNPFQNHLTIKFENRNTKHEIQKTTLKIYDASGRLLKQFNHLINYQSSIIWFGDDNSGRKLPAGVYFVKLESEGSKKVEPVILLR